MTKDEKKAAVEEIAERIKAASGFYLADFSGMTVEAVNTLRRDFFNNGVSFTVYKNTLIRLALKDIEGYDGLMDYLRGPTGIVFGVEDPVSPARIIKEFNKDHDDVFKVKACVIEQEIFDGSRLDEVAALPTRKDVMAGIASAVQYPIMSLASVVNASSRDLVNVLDAIVKKKEDAEAA
ncbi:MAG: 50S ribosomal protein L10 [Chlorobi bacterium]|nr:50S ribosomal protein L10 [Chlorobiota bacterium]